MWFIVNKQRSYVLYENNYYVRELLQLLILGHLHEDIRKPKNISKFCIVVEEVDEPQFWLELIEEAKLLGNSEMIDVKNENDELVKIFTVSKAKIKT